MNVAVFTMDDIPSANTPAIADYLSEKGITAVMFAVGQNLEQYFDNAVYALKKGMIIGNHSYTHPGFSSLTWEECVEQIEKTEVLLNKVYEAAGVERTYRPFRFPYFDRGGANEEALQEYLKKRGFQRLVEEQTPGFDSIDTRCTFDFNEWKIRPGEDFTKDSVLERMEELFQGQERHLLLMHAHDATEEQVPGYYKIFLDRAIERGMTFEKPRFMAPENEGDADRLHEALRVLKNAAWKMCDEAGKDESFFEKFWKGLCETEGMLREFAYFHDTGKFLCEKKVEGYTMADIAIWQVDHFKAYLDRGDDCLRYDSPKLVLSAFMSMLEMTKDPAPYLKKLQGESGTDRADY